MKHFSEFYEDFKETLLNESNGQDENIFMKEKIFDIEHFKHNKYTTTLTNYRRARHALSQIQASKKKAIETKNRAELARLEGLEDKYSKEVATFRSDAISLGGNGKYLAAIQRNLEYNQIPKEVE